MRALLGLNGAQLLAMPSAVGMAVYVLNLYAKGRL